MRFAPVVVTKFYIWVGSYRGPGLRYSQDTDIFGATGQVQNGRRKRRLVSGSEEDSMKIKIEIMSRSRQVFLAAVVLTLTLTSGVAAMAQDAAKQAAMDRDLMEVTIPKLEKMYADHKYTVTEVTEWYIARIDK